MHRASLTAVAALALIASARPALGQTTAPNAPDAPAVAAAKGPTATVDPKADDVIRRMTDFYRTFRTGSARMNVAVTSSQFGQEMKFDAATDLAYAHPNRLALRTTSEATGSNVVSDGKRLFLHVPQMGRYIEKDAPKKLDNLLEYAPDLAAVSAAGGMELDILSGLLSEDPRAALLEGVTAVTYLGQEMVKDAPSHHLLFAGAEMDVHVWVNGGKEAWLDKIQPDLAKFFAGMAEQGMGEVPDMTMVISFADWSRTAPAEDAFAFAVPEGTERVETFFEDMGGGGAGGDGGGLLGTAAPTFELDLLGGGRVDLAAHRGRDIVILDFWATWCGPCRKGMPMMQDVAKTYADKNVVFYAVNLQETDEKAQGFMKKLGYTFNVAMDRKGSVGGLYKATSIPLTVIIDRAGVVQAVHVGLLPNLKEQITGELDTLLRGESLVEAAG